MDQERINLAIQDCLDRCRGTDNPLVQIAAFLTDLRSAGWSRGEIRLVELPVHKILHALVDTAKMPTGDMGEELGQLEY